MKRAPRSQQHHDLYRQYYIQDREISRLLGECRIIDLGTVLGSDRAHRMLPLFLLFDGIVGAEMAWRNLRPPSE
jgi:hypothetical protein